MDWAVCSFGLMHTLVFQQYFNLMVVISFYSGEGNRNTCIKQTTRSPQARTLLNKGFTEVKLKSSLGQLLLNFYVTNDHEYVPRVVSISRHHWFVTRVTRRVPHVEQKLLTLPEHMSASPVFLMGFVLLDLCFSMWSFVDHCLSFCSFSQPLCCLSVFDLKILIAPFMSSNSLTLNSYIHYITSVSNIDLQNTKSFRLD